MKIKIIKESTIAIIIIVLSIAGIFKLNEIINYQLLITDINKIIVSEDFSNAEKTIKNSSLKVKDIDMLKEKIREGKAVQDEK